jgi:hypothetical protein
MFEQEEGFISFIISLPILSVYMYISYKWIISYLKFSPLSNNALSHQFSSMMMNSPSATSLSQTPLPLKTTQQASSSSPLSPTKDKPVRPPRTFEYTVGSTKMPAVSGPKETAVNDNDFAMKQAIHKNPQPPQKFIVPSPPQIVQKPIIQ